MLDGVDDMQAFGLVALVGIGAAGAVRAAFFGVREGRPILMLGGWLVAMAGAMAVLIAWPSVVGGGRPLWSTPMVAAFVRMHDLPLTAVLAIGTVGATMLELLNPARRGAAAEARAEAVGAAGEGLVKLELMRAGYPVVHGLMLGGEGWSTEIDHVVLVGNTLVVIETKTLSGRIEGRPGDAKWVQRTGERERWFQNPLRQNATHLDALRRAIGAVDVPIRGLVVVAGSATIGEGLSGCVVPLLGLIDVLRPEPVAQTGAAIAAWSAVQELAARGGDRQAHAAYARQRSRR